MRNTNIITNKAEINAMLDKIGREFRIPTCPEPIKIENPHAVIEIKEKPNSKIVMIMRKAILISAVAMMFSACNKNVKTVGVDEFEAVMESDDVTLVDVRMLSEYREGHIPGSLNIDVKMPTFEQNCEQGELKDTVAVYCRAGSRSLKAAGMLAKKGHFVYNLDGGFEAWEKAGKPVE